MHAPLGLYVCVAKEGAYAHGTSAPMGLKKPSGAAGEGPEVGIEARGCWSNVLLEHHPAVALHMVCRACSEGKRFGIPL